MPTTSPAIAITAIGSGFTASLRSDVRATGLVTAQVSSTLLIDGADRALL